MFFSKQFSECLHGKRLAHKEDKVLMSDNYNKPNILFYIQNLLCLTNLFPEIQILL